MSNDIEKKIVEIEFENRNFEKGIKRSQKSIQELNKSLEFKGSEKGIKNVEKALNNMRLDDISNSVKTISDRFSALGIVATTTLTRITNAAITTGKNLVKSFTIDPLTTGLQEYETQMNAIQTILANTKSKGTNLEQVNAALDELNHYADKTIYNFTQMTENIGRFTAAGVDLDASVSAIQGIANLAAVSGSSAQQASNAMYQLSQALAAGRVTIQDWNSVNTANMGGEVFQQALRKTSEELGTGAEAAIKANGNFRLSLQEGWLTSEVLSETLKKFTTSGAQEWVAEYTGLTQEAVAETLKAAEAQYGEADAVKEAAKQLAEKSGKNQQEIQDVLEMAKTAEDAATKVKTFTQLMDTLKEAVQSGWSETWRTVIGDFEEAKELFTGIKDAIDPVISRSADLRNNMLKVWKSLGGRTKLLEGLANIGNSILDIWNSISQAFYDIFGIVGKELYAMTVGFTEFTKELVVNEKTAEDLKRVVRGLASVIHIVVQVISAAAKAVLQVFVYLKPLFSTILHIFAVLGDGITILDYVLKRTQIFNRLGMAVARTLALIGDIAQNLLKLASAGGLKVFDVIFYVVRAVISLYKTIQKKFGGIGGFVSHEVNVMTTKFPELGQILKTLSTTFGEFGKKISAFITSIKSTFQQGNNVFDNLRAIGKIIKDAFGGAVDIIVNVVKTIGEFIGGLLDNFSLRKWGGAFVVISLLSMLIFGIFRLISGFGNIIADVSDAISEAIQKIGKSISAYINAKAMNERSQAIFNVAKAVALLAGSLVMLTFVDSDTLKSSAIALGIFAAGAILFVAGLNLLTAWLEKKGKISENSTKKFTMSLIEIGLGMLLIIKAVSNMQAEMNKTRAFGDASFVEALWGLILAFTALVALSTVMALVTSKWAPDAPDVIKSYVIQLIAVVVALKQLSDPSLDLGKGVIGLLAVAGFFAVFTAISTIASKFSTGEESWKNILASAIALKLVLATILEINTIPNETIMRALVKSLGVIIAFRMVIGASRKAGPNDASKTIQATAFAFLGLVAAMKILSKMDPSEIKRGTMGVIAMMGPMTILMLITKLGKRSMRSASQTIIAMAGAIAVMSLCAALLSLLNPSDMWRGVIAISIMSAVAGGMVALTKFANKTKQGVKTLMTMSIIIGVLSLCAGLLSNLDTKGMIVAFAGIAVVIGMMSLLMLTVKKIEPKAILSMFVMLIPMAAAIAAVAGALAVLQLLNVDASLETVAGLSLLLVALSVSMKIIGSMSPMGMLVGIVGLLGVGLALMLLFEIFGLVFTLMGNGDAIVNGAQMMGEAIGALIGGIAGGISAGVAATMPAVGTYMTEFMDNIQGFITGSQNMKNMNFGALFALTGLIATMSIVAPLATTLPIMGWGLQSLGIGLQDFMAATEGIDQTRLDAIGAMLSGIGNLALGMMGFQSTNLESFGKGLPALAKNITDFCNALLGEDGGASLSVETAQKGADIFAAFAKVAATVPRSGGFIGAVLGDVDLGAFVDAMGKAGPAIKSFHNDVTGLEYKNVQQGLKILEETIKIASTVPNSGGFLGMVVGENDLSGFTAMMVSAGPDIKTFTKGIKGTKYKDAKQGLQVLKETILAAQSIPNSGESVISAIVGDNTLEDFARQMASAGYNIAAFIEAMPVDADPEDSIDVYANATKAVQLLGTLIDVASSIDMQSGWEKVWAIKDDSLTAFGADLATFAPHFKTFWNEMAQVDVSGDEMKKKSDAMSSFLSHLAQFANLGDVTLPDISNLTGQNTVYSLAEGMVTASNSEGTKTKITEAGEKITSLLDESLDEESVKWSATTMVSTMSNGISDAVFNNSSFYDDIGEDILSYIGLGFIGKPMDELVATLSDGIVNGVKKSLGIESPSKKFQEIGRYIVEGLDAGLQNGKSELKTATNRMASTIENQFRDDMGIHSPSELFTDLGSYIVDGLKNGLGSEGSMDDILNDVLGTVDFGSMFGDYGTDMKDIFSGAFDGIDLSGFSMEGLDDGSFVDSLMSKIQDQMDDQGLTADVTAVFDADAMQAQLSGMTTTLGTTGTSGTSGTLSTTGTSSIASTTMDSFVNTKFDDSDDTETGAGSGAKNSFSFVQNNYSPTALDRIAIYRQTRNQFAAMKEAISKI